MSISGLISELRDSFLKKDFDRVEEALIVREARLRAEIEEKKREIRLLNEEIDFQRIEKMSVELELKRVKELIDRGDIACAVAERGNVGVSAASGNGFDLVEESLDVKEATMTATIEDKMKEIRLLHEKLVKKEKCATAKVKDEKVDVMAEKKSLADEPSKNAGLGGSSGNWWTNSSRVVSKNFTTKLAEPAGVLKRDFASSAGYVSNVLDGLDTDSSSSSSSSSSGEFDISSFTSLKRTKLS